MLKEHRRDKRRIAPATCAVKLNRNHLAVYRLSAVRHGSYRSAATAALAASDTVTRAPNRDFRSIAKFQNVGNAEGVLQSAGRMQMMKTPRPAGPVALAVDGVPANFG